MRSIDRCFCETIVTLALLVASSGLAPASVSVSLQPSVSYVEPDSVFKIFLHVDEEGSEFNGYDATILWDPQVLAFVSCQPESLFSQHNQWWVPEIGDGEVSISHVIMQGGVFETGPGALSSITFRADQNGYCPVVFDSAIFYRAGFLVTPVYTVDAVVHVGDPMSGIPWSEPPSGIELRVQPNPFKETAWIAADFDAGAEVRAWLFDASGRHLGHALLEGNGPATWPLDLLTRGGSLPAGVYFVSVRSGGITATTRIVRIH